MIKERIIAFRKIMKENELDAYIIRTSDYHNSEYVSDYFKEREFMSGFTGSAGTLVITQKKAALWTDGRYFIQAKEQLKNSKITLMKQGQEGVPDIISYLMEELLEGDGIGFDGRTFDASYAHKLIKTACEHGLRVKAGVDLPNEIWQERPKMPAYPVWEYDESYTGESRKDKLRRVREYMEAENAECHILSSLDDIAWLLNLRGNDVKCTPVFLAYMIIFKEKAYLYANKKIFSDEIKEALRNDNIEIRKYDEIYVNIKSLAVKSVMIDTNKVNFAIINNIDADKKIINKTNPTTLFKSIKNETETAGFRNAHIKDGVAITKFMYWFKQNMGKVKMTEISVAEKLLEFRREQKGFLDESFEPIMAYGKHGAIVHYSATKETDATIMEKSFLLSDTGAHYKGGTTDITRTFVCGELTKEEKKAYTLVMTANLRLAAMKFPKGLKGEQLDIIAREPLWEHGYNFNHGTGHGVGNVLSVHEGPQNISYGNRKSLEFKEGMITSNEPGLYMENKFGVRLENLILCKQDKMMSFETLTMVPFEKEAIDTDYMTDRDIRLLNEYHKKVRKTLSPYLGEDEKKWLMEATKEI